MSRDGCVALPRGAMGLSAVCDCGISWSYSLTIFSRLKLNPNQKIKASTQAFFLCHKCLTRNSIFLLKTNFCSSKLTFLTRNSLLLLETHFYYSKLAFLTRNSLFIPETRLSYSKLTFLTRNSLPTKSESQAPPLTGSCGHYWTVYIKGKAAKSW